MTHWVLLVLGALCVSLPASVQASSVTRTSAFEYDPASGFLVKEIIEPDSSTLCVVTTYNYDARGNKTGATTRNCNGSSGSNPGINSEAVAPGGPAAFTARSTSTGMDANGQFPISSTNALGQSESRVYNTTGVVTSFTGPNGLTTGWQYDGFLRKTLETRADGDRTATSFTLCNNDCPGNTFVAGAYYIATTPQDASGVTNGPVSRTFYDSLGRVIRSDTQGMDGSLIITMTEYDSLGRVSRSTQPFYDGQTYYWTSYAYDTLGRIIQTTAPDGTVTAFNYNGLTTSVTNAKGQTTTQVKDVAGQIAQTIDAQGNVLTHSFDAIGNLVQTLDPQGNMTTISYDTRGRKIQSNDPDMGLWQYGYNALGELVSQTDAKSQVSSMQYDLLGRLTQRNEPDLVSTWYYDKYQDGSACPQGIGKLCEARADNGYVRRQSYDSLGRAASTSTNIDGTLYNTGNTYDTNGRVLTQSYPSGLTIKYVYTALGYLKEVHNNDTSNALYWRADARDAAGRLTQQTYGNNVQTQYVFNPLTGLVSNIMAGAGNAVQNLAYSYDSLGNLMTRQDSNQNLTESFDYDGLNRLTLDTVNASAVSPPVTTAVAYNAIGNITCKSDLSACSNVSGNMGYGPTVNGHILPHALAYVMGTVDGQTNPGYTYDNNGNMLSGDGRTVTYTSFNMSASISKTGYSASFVYGPEHQRVKQITTTSSVIYLNPDSANGLLYERETQGTTLTQKHYITAGGQAIALITLSNGVWATKYQHFDHLGSLTAITDESGTVVERLAYDPWGKRRNANGIADPLDTIHGSATTQYVTDRGFTGHEHLDELGLINMNGRVFDPAIGRFMAADSNVDGAYNLQGYNRYSYALNNPTNSIDPTGYFKWSSYLNVMDKVIVGDMITPAGTTVGVYFGISPANPRPAFAFISNQPGQSVIDHYVTSNQWAYSVGQVAVTAVATYWGGPWAGASASAGWTEYYTYYSTGDAKAARKGAAISFATAMAFDAVGSYIPAGDYPVLNVLGHALVGCASAAASGGECGAGAASAATGAAWSNFVGVFDQNSPAGYAANVVVEAAVGGTASKLGGGSFSNGAITSAFGYLFNMASHGGGHMSSAQSTAQMIDVGKNLLTVAAIANPVGLPVEGAELVITTGDVSLTVAQAANGDGKGSFISLLSIGVGRVTSTAATALTAVSKYSHVIGSWFGTLSSSVFEQGTETVHRGQQ